MFLCQEGNSINEAFVLFLINIREYEPFIVISLSMEREVFCDSFICFLDQKFW